MNTRIAITFAVLTIGVVAARANQTQAEERHMVFIIEPPTLEGVEPVAAVSAAPAVPAVSAVTIETVEPASRRKQAKTVTWLGLAAEECSEALTSQLGLKPGEGLTVILVASDSPAEKADICKNDVLVEFDRQMLVHPLQLRKLVQMHSEGEPVELTFYRSGKKKTVSVKLGKTSWTEPETLDSSTLGGFQNFQIDFSGMHNGLQEMGSQMSALKHSLANAGMDKAQMDLEIKRTMEQTRKAVQDAVRRASSANKSIMLDSADRKLESLAREGVHVDDDATIIIRNKHNTTKTMVETDESGSYILEAGETIHLTARDHQGKLLFEGDIDTPAKRASVPKEVWEKVEPMFEQISSPHSSRSLPSGNLRHGSIFLKQKVCECVLPACLM